MATAPRRRASRIVGRWSCAAELANRSPGHPDDYCAICATIFLLSSSFVAAAPQLPLPVASEPVEHVASAVIVFIAPRRAPSDPADLRSRDLRSALTFDVAVRSRATVAGLNAALSSHSIRRDSATRSRAGRFCHALQSKAGVMFVRAHRASSYRTCRAYLLGGPNRPHLTVSTAATYAQVTLPQLTVRAARKVPAKPRVAPHRVVAAPARTVPPISAA